MNNSVIIYLSQNRDGGDKMNALKFKAAMVEAGYTQSSLAKAAKISPNTLSAKINGKSRLYVDDIQLFCNLLHIDSDSQKVEIFLSN